MEFCDDCGSMMKKDGERWVCGSCDATKQAGSSASYTVTEGQEETEVIESSDESALPETDALCPECGNDRARWYMQQIRSADESETRFFICTECEHKWREDDH